MLSELSPELIAKIQGIELRAKVLVNDVFAGEYQSAFKGKGMEFEEVREYQPGDDVRTIDWNVTARNDKPFVKLFRDERELTVLFVVDVSASEQFGTLDKLKHEVAAEIAALLAYTALRNNDKVGLIIFSDHVELYVPPKKGRGHTWRLIRDILSYKSKSKRTDFGIPLDFLNRVQKKRAICFLISDFQGASYDHKLRVTAKHHDLIAIVISDPREKELPGIGFVELEDAETGEFVLLNLGKSALRRSFKERVLEESKKRQDFFRSAGIDTIEVSTESSYVDPIVKFFRRREKRSG